MTRKVLLCVVILGVVLGLSGCAEQSTLKEEDMVSAKRDCYIVNSPVCVF